MTIMPNEIDVIENAVHNGSTVIIPAKGSSAVQIARILEAVENGSIKPELKGFVPSVDDGYQIMHLVAVYTVPNVYISVDGKLFPMTLTGNIPIMCTDK